jgi:hypothetical protein
MIRRLLALFAKAGEVAALRDQSVAYARALTEARQELAWSHLVRVRQAHEIETLELRCEELARLAHPSQHQGDER